MTGAATVGDVCHSVAMTGPAPDPSSPRPSRTRTAEAIAGTGWRLLVGGLHAAVHVGSPAEAVGVVALAVDTAGDDADGHLRLDVRAGVVLLRLQTAEEDGISATDLRLAASLDAAVTAAGFALVPTTSDRAGQVVEICIDAMHIPAVAPFWRAVLGYVDQHDPDGDLQQNAPLVDPNGQGPSFWFQQMDVARSERNRFHVDVIVGEDEADARIAAALAAGGRMVSDRAARSFWILADAEGNEVCVCTWQDRE